MIAVISDRALIRDALIALLQGAGIQTAEFRNLDRALESPDLSKLSALAVDLEGLNEAVYPALGRAQQASGVPPVIAIGSRAQAGAAGHFGAVFDPNEKHGSQLIAALGEQPVGASLVRTMGEPLPPGDDPVCWSQVTPRQREVLSWLAKGSDNLRIAAQLGISERTVKAHISSLLLRFECDNRVELARLAIRAGIRAPTGPAIPVQPAHAIA